MYVDSFFRGRTVVVSSCCWIYCIAMHMTFTTAGDISLSGVPERAGIAPCKIPYVLLN